MTRKSSSGFRFGGFCLYRFFAFHFIRMGLGQVQLGISVNAGNRQHYSSPGGFQRAFAPSPSLSVAWHQKVSERWFFRYAAVTGIVGYKLNVVMIDTLGPNGDVSPFAEYSTLFASAEFLFAHRVSVLHHNISIGAGIGITGYASASPRTSFGVEAVSPDNKLISLFDAELASPANRYSILWKAIAYYSITPAIALSVEYVYHPESFATGSYIFYHTRNLQRGKVEIYQREFRLGLIYTLQKGT